MFKKNICAIALVLGAMLVFSFVGCDNSTTGGNGGNGGNPTVPGTILSFTATPGNAQVTLMWSTLSNATGYEVTRDNWATKETKTASQNSHIYTGLANGTQYTFKVRGTNAQGAGPESTTTATPAIGELDQRLILPEGQGWVHLDIISDGYVFKSDGTYVYHYWGGGAHQTTPGTWSTSGSRLTITDYAGPKPHTYSISGDTLTMTDTWGDVHTFIKGIPGN
jgi:uncharacterized lipoprotein NlpE involved in copper resistance